ncbi:MAG: hypothetical protein WCL14_06275 [Bacteroidota bacterium]
MPSENKVQIQSMRGVKTKITFLVNKVTGPPAVVYVGDAVTWGKITNYNVRMTAAYDAMLLLEGQFKTNNDLMVPALMTLQEWEAGYYSTFITGNKLKYFPNADRALIGLNLTNDVTPARDTYPEIIESGALIISGDAKRILAGSAAMAIPSIANFTAKYTPANTYFNTNSNLGVLYSAALKTYMDLLAEGIALVNKSDNEIETHFNDGDRAAMRHNSGYWGVHYSSATPISYLNITVLDKVTNLPLEHVLLLANPGLEEGETNIDGYDSMNIHTFGPLVLEFTLVGYQPGTATFESINGETIVRTLFLAPLP